MYSTMTRTATNVNDQPITKTVYWTQRKPGKSESEQKTERMINTAKAERRARGRVGVQEEI